MKELMKIKLAIKKFVGKNEVFIMPVLKFLLTFLCLSKINSSVGFMTRLTSTPITLIIALAGSFLPLNLMIVIIGLIIVAHMYALAIECAIAVLALLLIMYLLYFRFASQDSIGGMLTPLSFVYHVPFTMPVSMGLVGTPSSMISVGTGVVIYKVLHFISENSETLSNRGEENVLGQFKIIVDALLGNKDMIVYVVAFAATVLVVYLIRRLSIKYAWLIAIGAGELTLLFVTIIANSSLDAGISIGKVFGGVIVSAIINVILCYFCFDLNYDKIEKVQFEDDEYYYYVKAIPKNEYLSKPQTKKKKSSSGASQRPTQRPTQQSTQSQAVTTSGSTTTTRREVPVSRPRPSQTSSDEAAAAIRSVSHSTNTNKGPLGLSGGRPAGEGRRRLEQQNENRNKDI